MDLNGESGIIVDIEVYGVDGCIVNVIRCYNTGNVSGKQYVGGIVGDIEYDDYAEEYANIGAILENCYNSGKIEATDSVGGIAGEYCNSIILRNCYNAGEIVGSTIVGGVVGYVDNWYEPSVNVIENCYYYKTDTGLNSTVGILGKIVSQDMGTYNHNNNGTKGFIQELTSKLFIKETMGWSIYENGTGIWKINESDHPKLWYQ